MASLLLQAVARWLDQAASIPELYVSCMTFVSILLIGGCTIYMVTVAPSRLRVRLTMWLAAIDLATVELLHLAQVSRQFNAYWLFQPGNVFLNYTFRFLDLGGISLWMIGFYLLIFEVSRNRAALLRRTQELQEEVRERKAAQTILAQRESQLFTIFNQASMAILITNIRGAVLQCNKAACTLLQYDEAELTRESIQSITHPENVARSLEHFRLLHEHGNNVADSEERYIRKDGSEVSMRVRMGLAKPPGESDPLVIVMMEDLTDEKREEEARRNMEAQMLRAQKLESLGNLAGGFAHDFNNLLVGVMGNADLLLHETPESSDRRRILESIVSSSRRAADLCQNLLAYAGKRFVSMERVDLTSLTRQAVEFTHGTLPEGVTCHLMLEEPLPASHGDPSQIQQVILNLLSNSIDAMQDRTGCIRVATGTRDCDAAFLEGMFFENELEAGRYVYVEVTDSGWGMDAETLSRVFDPFFTTKQFGSGLGLAAVLGIVKSHRSAISMESVPGQGTAIRVYFPAMAASLGLMAPDPREAPVIDARGTVLVVDDESQVRDLAQHILKREGYSVVGAEDGLRGLEYFRAQREAIVAVVLDLSMPGLNGIALAQQIRALDPGVPIILSSGYAEHELRERHATDCVSGLLKKPYRRGQLLAVLDSVLNGGSMTGSHE
ncbi:MAG: response regulator [Candidatus Hydrogenedentes bacterium]|nr:response regulator [Candidatus Hydrogenedentota bacterium]